MPPQAEGSPLLVVEGLTVGFPLENGWARAVRGLGFSLQAGEILGLVGESGCGKSITSLAVLGLLPSPGKRLDGSVRFEGQELGTLPAEAMRKLRGSQIAMIPQDPLTSLNPVYPIGEQIAEVLRTHTAMDAKAIRQRVVELLESVRIPNAADRLNDYPHQFSGGMRQRVMIAMALACSPKLLIADEPTTALDVTVQAQILELMREIRQERGTAILLITHDLGVVAELCDRVAVMYAGQLVEEAPVEALFASPKHPYTQGLLRSLPRPGQERLEPIAGQPPSIARLPSGCSFEPRCAHRMDTCAQRQPQSLPLPEDGGRRVACFLYHPPEDAPTPAD